MVFSVGKGFDGHRINQKSRSNHSGFAMVNISFVDYLAALFAGERKPMSGERVRAQELPKAAISCLIIPTQSMGTIKIAAFGSSYRRTVRSGLGFVIQRGVEVGALLQVFLGVALGVGFFAGDFDVGTGWQYHGGRNGGSGDDGEEIEIHGGNPRVRLLGLPGRAVKQT
jgi:hypothetical protein